MLCHPIHEIVRDAADNDRFTGLRIEEAIEDGKLPPAYHENPVVIAVGDARPVSFYYLFFDGVRYTFIESVLGFLAAMLDFGECFLACVLRKRTCWRCGCQGWCTFHAIHFSFVLVISPDGRGPEFVT